MKVVRARQRGPFSANKPREQADAGQGGGAALFPERADPPGTRITFKKDQRYLREA